MSLTNEDVVNRLTSILREMETLREDTKALMEEAKEAELNIKWIRKTAALIVKNKEADYVEETQGVISLLEEVKGV